MTGAPDNLQQDQVARLPSLRQDLEIIPGRSEWTGTPTWLIHDPVRGRFFRVGNKAMAMLNAWRPVPAGKLAERLSQNSGEVVMPEEVENTARFLLANALARDESESGWRDLLQQAQSGRKALWKRLAHNYIFFRIPLLRPQRFLDATWPLVALLFTRWAAYCFFLLGMLSLYLVSRQWEVFTATFLSFFSLEGFIVYGLSLVFIKAIHELGHGYMATKFGVQVPVIGAAFILLMPILYTDTSAAHRLRHRDRKLHIDLAGIYCELALAVIATLFWVFLPDGPMRSVAFSTATLSWIMSLSVNLNPFMRFDGYYVLSDALGFENLQERGFAVAKWRLREALFGLGRPPPEYLPTALRRIIILHAWGTWIYRFFLFLGIALLVYQFFIKAIGIFLFAVEICWFILAPLLKELAVWWQQRKEIALAHRSRITLAILVLLLLVFFIPWSGRVEVAAVARPGQVSAIHAVESGQIIEAVMVDRRRVEQGDLLLRLGSPDLEETLAQARQQAALLTIRLVRSGADRREQSLRLVLEQELASKEREIAGLEHLHSHLEIRADRSGMLVNVDQALQPGLWISPEQRLAYLLPESDLVFTGMVDEYGVARIARQTHGIFIPDDPARSKIPVRVSEIGEAALPEMSEPLLADIHGGPVPVHAPSGGNDAVLPISSWYPVRLVATSSDKRNHATDMVLRGVVIIQGERQSFASRTLRRIAGVLLRESGF